MAETVGPIAQATLQFVPGAKVQYSNAGFYVLGRIIEIASGRPYADYVKEEILDPLGMKESFYPRGLASVEPRRMASVYRQRQGERFLYFRYEPGMTTRNDTPDGGLFCTARDLFKFCQMFLDNDGRILSKDSVGQMLREQAPGRGLGWALENGGFGHGGSSGAYAWGDPHTGLVAILLIQYNDFRRIPRLHTEFIAAVRTAYQAESKSAGVSLLAPEEGGTPRDASRIVAVGPGEFRIRACTEEGRSVLTHAVSRVDLICRNDGAKAQDVTLHLDLSDDGRRTNADNNAFGGMSTRDFIFIQPPGQPWRQINGHVYRLGLHGAILRAARRDQSWLEPLVHLRRLSALCPIAARPSASDEDAARHERRRPGALGVDHHRSGCAAWRASGRSSGTPGNMPMRPSPPTRWRGLSRTSCPMPPPTHAGATSSCCTR